MATLPRPGLTASGVVLPKVVIVGPTASGKSQVAMAAAARVPGTEIVAIDAMQVYRGMDIGTAKPTSGDRQAVPHHGLDLVAATEAMAVAQFRAAVDASLGEIAARGGTALAVAGTGLYLTAALDRLELPGTWPDVKATLESELADAASPTALYARLERLDPDAAARIEPDNGRRIIRALEVTIGSGRPFSSYGPGVTAFPPVAAVQLGIRWPREVLAARIADRVEAMMAAGLLDEVRSLRRSGLSPTAAQALGYKELVEHLDGHVSLDDAVDTIVRRTRRFALRQERWFRRDPRIGWIDIDPSAVDPLAPAVAATVEELRRP